MPAVMAAASLSTKNVAMTAATARTRAIEVVTMPPGVRYGRGSDGSRNRSTMCDRLSSTYETVAPNTAMLISSAPSCVIAASRNPIVPGTISAMYGVRRRPVTDSQRGR